MYPNLPYLNYTETGNFFLIAGPCVIEDHENPFEVCERLVDITNRLQIPFAFKASYRKANRSSVNSFTGIGDREGLEMLRAAAETGKCVNVKKGQFLSPEAMKQVSDKMRAFGCENFMLTERGTTFGYQDLVVDFRGVPTMQHNRVPVVVDITHSLQQPNQTAGVTGGRPDMIETIGRAAIAVGADGIFMETHPEPARAKSDGANMLRLDLAEKLLGHLTAIRKTINEL